MRWKYVMIPMRVIFSGFERDNGRIDIVLNNFADVNDNLVVWSGWLLNYIVLTIWILALPKKKTRWDSLICGSYFNINLWSLFCQQTRIPILLSADCLTALFYNFVNIAKQKRCLIGSPKLTDECFRFESQMAHGALKFVWPHAWKNCQYFLRLEN